MKLNLFIISKSIKSFFKSKGEKFVELLCNSEKGLPQAIACANDAMAVSVYKALEKRGLRIPENILVIACMNSFIVIIISLSKTIES